MVIFSEIVAADGDGDGDGEAADAAASGAANLANSAAAPHSCQFCTKVTQHSSSSSSRALIDRVQHHHSHTHTHTHNLPRIFPEQCVCSAQYAGEKERERMATADQSPESRTRAARRERREGKRDCSDQRNLFLKCTQAHVVHQ